MSEPAHGVRFTIEPRWGGFTDQLMQFAALYRLGRSLGWEYRHTPFASRRSEPPPGRRGPRRALAELARRVEHRGALRALAPVPDAYGFLGFNAAFRERGLLWDPAQPALELALGDADLGTAARDLGALQQAVRRRREAADGADRVRLRFAGGRRFFETLLAAEPGPEELDLRGAYEAERARDPWRSPFRPGTLRILMHVRLGDTATLRTPWGTWLPLWPRPEPAFREFAAFGEIPGKRQMRVAEFARFLDRLDAVLPPDSRSLVVFSDGFERAFHTLRARRERPELTPERRAALLASERGYEARAFAPLRERPGNSLFVGESPTLLCALIHAALEADVVVIGSQQRMLAKLLASYAGPPGPRVVLVHRGGAMGRDPGRVYRVLGWRPGEQVRDHHLEHGDYADLARWIATPP